MKKLTFEIRSPAHQQNAPKPRSYPRDRVLRRLVKIDTDFQCDIIIRNLDLK
ncbi:DUF7301 family protein [Escherichia coli]|uniref:DUF7301 family protein n=1 Tax=Escherichia coli TaxID=562 RepID=UPI003B28363B